MAGWKLFGRRKRAATIDPDLCLNPPSGFPAAERAHCCTQLIEHGNPAMRAHFHNARGLAYRDVGRVDEGRREIDKAIDIQPHPVFFINRAYMAKQAGETELALADLARALELDPQHVRAYEDRAGIYHDVSQPEKGLRDIEQALAKPTGYRNRLKGQLLMQLDQYDDAIASLSASLELEPGNAIALERRSTCHLMLDRFAEAAADAEAALASKPNMAAAHLALATALDIDDPERALHHFAAALVAGIDDGPTLNNRAFVLGRLGDQAGAGSDFDRAVELMPDEPLVRNNRALWRIEAGDFAGAEADLKHCLVQVPGHASMICGLAQLAVIRGEPDEGERMLAGILAHLPSYADAHVMMGWTRLAQRRHQEAAAAFERALEQPRGRDASKQNDRVRWEALYGRGLAREGLGDMGGDDRACARAIRPDADEVVARWGHGGSSAGRAHH